MFISQKKIYIYIYIAFSFCKNLSQTSRSPESLSPGEDVNHKIQIPFLPLGIFSDHNESLTIHNSSVKITRVCIRSSILLA